jgi:hypothetical protein
MLFLSCWIAVTSHLSILVAVGFKDSLPAFSVRSGPGPRLPKSSAFATVTSEHSLVDSDSEFRAVEVVDRIREVLLARAMFLYLVAATYRRKRNYQLQRKVTLYVRAHTLILEPYSSLLVSCMIAAPITFSNSLASGVTMLSGRVPEFSSFRLPRAPCRTVASLVRLRHID